MSALRVVPVSTATAEVADLIGALNKELSALYTPDQRHGLALEEIFQPHIRFFVARDDDQAVGCGGVALFADFAEIKRMFVRKDWRGRGVADAIMAELADAARGAGLQTLLLETGQHSHAAMAFYKRSGFVPCAVFGSYAALPPHSIETSLFFEKRLAP